MGPEILALLLAAQTATTPPPQPEKPRLVCRKNEQEIGSHIRASRRCKTEEEWAREDEEKTRMSASTQIIEGQGDSLTNSSPPH